MENTFDPMAFGKRLSELLKGRGWDVRTFQRALLERIGKNGTSYATVWSYVKGHAPLEPRREVIAGMAELFNVLPDHLLFGGPKTEAEAALKREHDTDGFLDDLFREIPELRDLDFSVQAALHSYLFRWTNARAAIGRPVETNEIVPYAARVFSWLREPVDQWAGVSTETLSVDAGDFSDYLTAMLNGLNLSLRLVVPSSPALTVFREQDDA